MHADSESFRLIQRQCGGWLAISAHENPLKIGVTGETADQAADAFRVTSARWREILIDSPEHVRLLGHTRI